jgi:diguanylate cyclase (GGDEF)-like protein
MIILIAEDDPVSRRILEATLIKWGHEVIACSDGHEAWLELQKDNAPSLLIFDWMMPGMDGIELCKKVRQMEREPYSFIILLTAKSQQKDIVIGMKAGADDYLIKPFDKNELEVRLRAGERILNLQTELISAREQLREQATHDPLTGIWNHKSIFDIINRELVRARRQGMSVTILMADIDHFKKINDTYGHLAGDKVLCEITGRLKAAIRTYDDIGRFGGDEFLLVLPGCSESDITKLTERLRTSIDEKEISIDEETVAVTVSFGAVTYSEEVEIQVDTLIKAADAALYKAKKEGRNCAVISSRTE